MMRKTLLIMLHAAISTSLGYTQSKLNVSTACSYYGEKSPTSIYTFASDNEATSALNMITEASGLSTNFKLMAANVPNAAAVIFNNERYILYNQTFMYNISQRINYWASISILAHEVGHHLNGHSLTPGGSRPKLELEADKFSGFILAKLGASLNDAQSAINALVSEVGTLTHPGKTARLSAIANGWYHNSSQEKRESSSLLILKPTKLFGASIHDKNSQQVFLTRLSNGKIKLFAEKGYVFRESEYNEIRITKDVVLFWFSDFNSYGYLTDFSEIIMNSPIELKLGTTPVYLDGIYLESEYMIVYFTNGSFHVISHGEVVTNKARYVSSVNEYVHPEIKKISKFDDDTIHLYEIPADGKLKIIEVSQNQIDKAAFSKNIIVSRGNLKK